jgi:lysophospholipase L1-like esterase
MRKKSWSWLMIASVSVLSIAVLASGFGLAVAGPKGQSVSSLPVREEPVRPASAQSAKRQEAEKQTIKIVALGDSLTKGVGDEAGKGYAGYLKEKLEKNGRKVVMQNFGVSGLESGELLKSVQSPGMQAVLREADAVVISIGGNDLTHSVGDFGRIFDPKGLDEQKLRQTQEQYTNNLEGILQVIRKQNQQAPVLMFGLFNPFEGLIQDTERLNRHLIDWNANLTKVVQSHPGMKVVPTFDLFQGNVKELLSVDHFHPNGSGYERMAERMAQVFPRETQK